MSRLGIRKKLANLFVLLYTLFKTTCYESAIPTFPKKRAQNTA